jgi:hypothetical protein
MPKMDSGASALAPLLDGSSAGVLIPEPVTFRKGVTPRLPFRRPAQTVAALVDRAHPGAD